MMKNNKSTAKGSLGGGKAPAAKGKKAAPKQEARKTYDTSNTIEYRKVRIAFDPEIVQAGETELVKIKFYHGNRNANPDKPRFTDSIVTATFRKDDKRFAYVLTRLRAGDFICVAGEARTRVYLTKDGKPGMEIEIPFANVLIPLVDLKDREELSSGGDEDEDEDDTEQADEDSDDFFGEDDDSDD